MTDVSPPDSATSSSGAGSSADPEGLVKFRLGSFKHWMMIGIFVAFGVGALAMVIAGAASQEWAIAIIGFPFALFMGFALWAMLRAGLETDGSAFFLRSGFTNRVTRVTGIDDIELASHQLVGKGLGAQSMLSVWTSDPEAPKYRLIRQKKDEQVAALEGQLGCELRRVTINLTNLTKSSRAEVLGLLQTHGLVGAPGQPYSIVRPH